MKDKPAFSTSKTVGYVHDKGSSEMTEIREDYPGLTKREYFAGRVLARLAIIIHEEDSEYIRNNVVWAAVSYTDALIAELERRK
jgi:hypothetical protein